MNAGEASQEIYARCIYLGIFLLLENIIAFHRAREYQSARLGFWISTHYTYSLSLSLSLSFLPSLPLCMPIFTRNEKIIFPTAPEREHALLYAALFLFLPFSLSSRPPFARCRLNFRSLE